MLFRTGIKQSYNFFHIFQHFYLMYNAPAAEHYRQNSHIPTRGNKCD